MNHVKFSLLLFSSVNNNITTKNAFDILRETGRSARAFGNVDVVFVVSHVGDVGARKSRKVPSDRQQDEAPDLRDGLQAAGNRHQERFQQLQHGPAGNSSFRVFYLESIVHKCNMHKP